MDVPGFAQRAEVEPISELDSRPARDEQFDQDDADQAVALREAHAAIGREGIADERGDKDAPEAEREVSPEVDEAEVAAEVAAAAKRGKTVELGGGSHVVTSKDSLWSLAAATYGAGKYWKKLRAANPGKVRARRDGTRDLIRDGESLVLPVLEIPTLEAMQAFAGDDASLRDIAVGMSDADYEAFLATMPTGTRIDQSKLLQWVEIMRSTGMTYVEMIAEQRRFFEEQAAIEGVSVGEYVASKVSTGHGQPHGTSEWDKEVADHREPEWQTRFDSAVEVVRTQSRPEVQAAIREATDHGGGKFIWDPAAVLKQNAYALGAHWNITVGMDWVRAVEEDVERVAAGILHEMIAHADRTTSWSGWIAHEAVNGLEEAERTKAHDAGQIGKTYGYWEQEVFAELYEFSLDSGANLTDHAFDVNAVGDDMTKGRNSDVNDVRSLLSHVQPLISPQLMPGIVRGLWRRIEADPRILDRAKALFRRDVAEVFGDVL